MSKNLHDRLAETREEIQIAAALRNLDELVRLLEVAEELDALIMLEEGDTSCGISALTADAIHAEWLEEQRLEPGNTTEPHIGALTNTRRQRPKPPHWSYPLIMGFLTGLVVVVMAVIGLLL